MVSCVNVYLCITMHVQACLLLHQKCGAAWASLLLYFQSFFLAPKKELTQFMIFFCQMLWGKETWHTVVWSQISVLFHTFYFSFISAAANMFLCTSLCDCNIAKRSPLKPLVKLKDVMYFSNLACVALLMIQNTSKYNWSGV